MIAGLLLEPKGQFYPPQHHILIAIIPGDSLFKKMLAKLSSTEQIFTETSGFQVPVNHGEYSFAKTIIVNSLWNRWIISWNSQRPDFTYVNSEDSFHMTFANDCYKRNSTDRSERSYGNMFNTVIERSGSPSINHWDRWGLFSAIERSHRNQLCECIKGNETYGRLLNAKSLKIKLYG